MKWLGFGFFFVAVHVAVWFLGMLGRKNKWRENCAKLLAVDVSVALLPRWRQTDMHGI